MGVTLPVHYRYEKLIRIAGVNVIDPCLFETTLIIYYYDALVFQVAASNKKCPILLTHQKDSHPVSLQNLSLLFSSNYQMFLWSSTRHVVEQEMRAVFCVP